MALPLLGVYQQEAYISLPKNMYKKVRISTIHNNPQMEVIRIYTYHRITDKLQRSYKIKNKLLLYIQQYG